MDKEIIRNQNRKVTVFALFLSLVSIGVLVFGFLLVSSNKVILLQSISNIYNRINVFQDNEFDLLNKIASSQDIGIKSQVSVKTDDEVVGININYLENKDDNKTRLDLIVNYLNEELVNGNVVLQNNKLYFFLKDIMQDYYYISYPYQDYIKTLASSDYSKLLEFVKDSIDEVIKNDDIKKEKMTVEYNGKNKKVNKLTYKIRNEELNKMINYFTKLLKGDKKLYKSIASSLKISEKELDSEINSLNSLFEKDKDKLLFEYDVYYYGFNKIFRYDLKVADLGVTISYQENNNNSVIKLFTDEKDIIKLVVKGDKEKYSYELTIDDIINNQTYTITGTYTNDNLVINYDKNKVDIKSNTVEKDGTYTNNNSITLLDDDDKVTIDLTTTYYFNEKVNFNNTKAISTADITEEDYKLMIENFMNTKLYEVLSSFEKIINLPEEFNTKILEESN